MNQKGKDKWAFAFPKKMLSKRERNWHKQKQNAFVISAQQPS